MLPTFSRWLGKVAVVTGANSGIGFATSKKLAEAGITVIGIDKNVEQIKENSKHLCQGKGQLHAIKADLTREEEILSAFKTVKENFGPLSILINNAGSYVPSHLLNGNSEDWRNVLDVNVLALTIASREAVKIMKENDIDGHIVNVCSVAGHRVFRSLGMYAPSKFAVKAVTQTIRLELVAEKSRIKIGCISPGTVNTPMVATHLEKIGPALTSYDCLNPEDIANAVVYILSTPSNVQIEDLIIRPLGDTF